MPRPIANPAVVAVVGATGLAGETLLPILEQRRFPVAELRPLASARSAGSSVRFGGRDIPVGEATVDALVGADVVFFAATGELSRELGPAAAQRGAVVIDKSSTFRMRPEVPLVVPEINPRALGAHAGIIACPNCTTIGLVMALEPIRRAAGLREVVVTTLQAASGAGRPGFDELERQTKDVAAGRRPEAEVFPAPIEHNLIPLCERMTDSGYSTEEHKLMDETRKILGLPELQISVTCVRAPVPVGHSASVFIRTEEPLTAERARAGLRDFPGVRLLDTAEHPGLPTPADAAGADDVLVGRVRNDQATGQLWLWQVADNLRKGAALNAVQIAEALL